MTPSRLHDQIAVVTGAARRIGRAIAERLAREGDHLALLDLDPAPALALADAIRATGVRSLALRADVGDRASIVAAMAQVERRLGPPPILVNNAGIFTNAPLLEVSPEDWRWRSAALVPVLASPEAARITG